MNNICISNIAWDKSEDKEIYELLREYNINFLEIAPTRIFEKEIYDTSIEKINILKKELLKYGIQIVALQSLVYQREDLTLFETKEKREELYNYLVKSIIFAKNIGAKILIFGSPKNRIMHSESNYLQAITFFKKIGEVAFKNGVFFCIEANPIIYGTNFITNTEEAIKFLKEIANPGIGLHIDIGTMLINNESLNVIEKNIDLIKHIHISEPFLNTISDKNHEIHKNIFNILTKNNYKNFISIEMKKQTHNNKHIIEKVLKYILNLNEYNL